jgi:hypothetical protein
MLTALQILTATETYVDVCISVFVKRFVLYSVYLVSVMTFQLANFMCYILASCQSDEECGLTEKCLQGQCNNPCDQPSACGMNAECRVFSHNKQCSCPPGFTGNQDVECVRSKYCIVYFIMLQNNLYSSMQNIYNIFVMVFNFSSCFMQVQFGLFWRQHLQR